MRPWAVDVSYAQDWDLPWAEFKAQGCVLGFVKSSQAGRSDPETGRHVGGIREAELGLGLYHYVETTVSWRTQAARFVLEIREHGPDLIAPDVEQWWKSWDEHWRFSRGLLAKDKVRRVPASQISEVGRLFSESFLPGWQGRLLPYSYPDFVASYAPQMIAWLKCHAVWWAQWIHGGGKIIPIDWPAFHALLETVKPPTLPAGVKQWAMRQFTSSLLLPGCKRRLDVSVFNPEWLEGQAWAQNVLSGG